MIAEEERAQRRGALRRDLVRRYVQLQRELIDADPMSSTYQSTVNAFRQMGYSLIASGFEEDLDRLLRLRVLEGGGTCRAGHGERTGVPDMVVMERRRL